MSSSPVDHRVVEERVGEVIAGFPAGEDILERAGVDYWFRSDETLGAACAASHVDPYEIASRLAVCHPCAQGDLPAASLAALLRESDGQWRQRLAPAIEAGIASASLRGCTAITRLLHELKKRSEKHAATSRSLLPVADAIERGEPGILHQKTLRTLRLEHLELARIARDLRAHANASPADEADLADALRRAIREIQHHLMVSYNLILPRLVAATAAKAVVCEPW